MAVRRRQTAEERESKRLKDKEQELIKWVAKTKLGKMVQNEEIKSLDEVFAKNMKILEPEIVDTLLSLEEEMVDFKKTSRVVRAGRKFSFRVTMLVGDKNKYVGYGTAKDVERFPAMRKAVRKAKLNLVEVKKGCGSWECTCGAEHSVPFEVEGKCASVHVRLIPAPKGVGLVAGDNIKKVLEMAGLKDVWTKTSGNTRTKLNFVIAAVDALSKTGKMRMSDDIAKKFEHK
ncbi:MAG: 30S ribosomal protein S5 [Candidatus Diapherotrites archaeon]